MLWRGEGSAEGAGVAEIESASIYVSSESIPESDRRKIEAQAREELLAAREYPLIVYRAAVAEPGPEGRILLQGELTLRGRSKPFSLEFTPSPESGVFRCESGIDLPSFGIRPPSAMLGALRCAPFVPVAIELRPPS